jgi:predicted Fe-Mo cluster-binding NifX family protein
MKVLIPVIDNRSAKFVLADGLHNADYACIYDSDYHTYEWVATDSISYDPGNLSLELKRKGIYTVISKQMSLMAMGLFAESGLTVLKASSPNVNENIDLFVRSELKPLTIQSVLASSCHGSCSSCSSTCN